MDFLHFPLNLRPLPLLQTNKQTSKQATAKQRRPQRLAMADGLVPIRRALVSVFDKTDIGVMGPALVKHGVTVLSTGGTAKALRDAGVAVVDVQDVTKWPEMLGQCQLSVTMSLGHPCF